MIYLLDGSNILGGSSRREHAEATRELIQAAASLARRQRKKVILFFDGTPSENLAGVIGRLTIRFSGSRSADDMIVEAASKTKDPVTVVTADAELSRRVTRRNVTVVNVREFHQLVGEEAEAGSSVAGDDWERYFSDPKNRN